MDDHDFVEGFDEECNCPEHNTPWKKTYRFGSSMSAETEVVVFKGCRCAVAIKHDPCCCLPSVATYHTSYDNASGVGRLRAMDAAVKYR